MVRPGVETSTKWKFLRRATVLAQRATREARSEPEWNVQRSGTFHVGRRCSPSEQRAKRVVNPSLSASILVSYSLLQTTALNSLPTGCPKSSRPIASRNALGAKCIYRSVMLSVEWKRSSYSAAVRSRSFLLNNIVIWTRYAEFAHDRNAAFRKHRLHASWRMIGLDGGKRLLKGLSD